MESQIVEYEGILRLSFFLVIFLLISGMEVLFPKRKLLKPKLKRWLSNLGLTFFNTILLRFIFPTAAVGVVIWTQQQGWGILQTLGVKGGWNILISVIFLDAIIYMQHLMFHAVPLLWRLHKVHHADPDYDVTTGARFHTIEILLSMLIKMATILLLGPSVAAVILFEVILNGMAMFNHGNYRLPIGLDKVLRCIVVTPDMHRVHHSVISYEANSNFGFNLSIWDRIFGTYKAQPDEGHQNMDIGIYGDLSDQKTINLFGMLLLPFSRSNKGYAINSRKWK